MGLISAHSSSLLSEVSLGRKRNVESLLEQRLVLTMTSSKWGFFLKFCIEPNSWIVGAREVVQK